MQTIWENKTMNHGMRKYAQNVANNTKCNEIFTVSMSVGASSQCY